MEDNILNFAEEVGKDMAAVQNKTAQINATDDSSFRVRDELGRVAFEVDGRGDLVAGGVPVKAGDGWRIRDEHGRVALEVDEHGRTHIHDPAFQAGDSDRPIRTNSDAKFAPGDPQPTTYYPTYMDPIDRRTMINHNSSTLRYSTDEGETWHEAHKFTVPVRSGIIMANGEVLVANRASGATDDGFHIMLSDGWSVDPTTATWTEVAGRNAPGVTPSAAFSWSHHKNVIVFSEYGPKLGQTGVIEGEEARYAYLSLDYGKTWARIFDLLTDVPDVTQHVGMHIHGCLYDPYWDRIWITYGDDENGTVFSDDLGRTWHTAHHDADAKGPYQLVGMYALPQCVLFATDGHPNGVMRISRSAGKHTGPYDFEIGYLYDDVQTLTILCQSVWRAERPGNDAPVVFEFVSAPGEGRRFILTTVDGYTFNKVWEDPLISRGNSSGSAYGPTVSGRLLHYAVDEYFPDSSRTLRAGPMPNAY